MLQAHSASTINRLTVSTENLVILYFTSSSVGHIIGLTRSSSKLFDDGTSNCWHSRWNVPCWHLISEHGGVRTFSSSCTCSLKTSAHSRIDCSCMEEIKVFGKKWIKRIYAARNWAITTLDYAVRIPKFTTRLVIVLWKMISEQNAPACVTEGSLKRERRTRSERKAETRRKEGLENELNKLWSNHLFFHMQI